MPTSICRIRRCRGVWCGRTGGTSPTALACPTSDNVPVMQWSTTPGEGSNGRADVEQVDERGDRAGDRQQPDRRGEDDVCGQGEPEDPQPGRLGQLVRRGERVGRAHQGVDEGPGLDHGEGEEQQAEDAALVGEDMHEPTLGPTTCGRPRYPGRGRRRRTYDDPRTVRLGGRRSISVAAQPRRAQRISWPSWRPSWRGPCGPVPSSRWRAWSRGPWPPCGRRA